LSPATERQAMAARHQRHRHLRLRLRHGLVWRGTGDPLLVDPHSRARAADFLHLFPHRGFRLFDVPVRGRALPVTPCRRAGRRRRCRSDDHRGLIMEYWILFGVFAVLMVIGTPIAYCLGIASFATIVYLGRPAIVVFQQLNSGISAFSLLAIPFFIFAGDLMMRGGIAARIIAFAG